MKHARGAKMLRTREMGLLAVLHAAGVTNLKLKTGLQGEASPAAPASSSSAARSAANAVPRDWTVTSPSVTAAISCTLCTCTADKQGKRGTEKGDRCRSGSLAGDA